MKLLNTAALFIALLSSVANATDTAPDALIIDGEEVLQAENSNVVLSNVQIDLSNLQINNDSLNSLLNSGDITLHTLGKLNNSESTSRGSCVSIVSETSLYSVSAGANTTVKQYNTNCNSGIHSIEIRQGRLLIASIYKYENSTWRKVAGSQYSSSASYSGGAGSYKLVVTNIGISTSSGTAKTRQSF